MLCFEKSTWMVIKKIHWRQKDILDYFKGMNCKSETASLMEIHYSIMYDFKQDFPALNREKKRRSVRPK